MKIMIIRSTTDFLRLNTQKIGFEASKNVLPLPSDYRIKGFSGKKTNYRYPFVNSKTNNYTRGFVIID